MGCPFSTHDLLQQILQNICFGRFKERAHLQDPRTDEKIILKCIIKYQGTRAWPGIIWLVRGTRVHLL
jgi:hypothetical protein